jgi:hypothetical protein
MAGMDRRPARQLDENRIVTAQATLGLTKKRFDVRRRPLADGRMLGHGELAADSIDCEDAWSAAAALQIA